MKAKAIPQEKEVAAPEIGVGVGVSARYAVTLVDLFDPEEHVSTG